MNLVFKMMVRITTTKEWTIGGQTGVKVWPEATPKQGAAAGKTGQQPKNRATMQIFTLERWNFKPNTNVRS